MERGPDHAAALHFDRFETGLPQGVPVHRLDTDVGSSGNALLPQALVHPGLAVGQAVLGDIGLQHPSLFRETLEGEIGQESRHDLRLRGIRHGNGKFDIVHFFGILCVFLRKGSD